MKMPDSSDPANPCPSNNALAACLEGGLPHSEMAAIQEHAGNCPACRALLDSQAAYPAFRLHADQPESVGPGHWVDHYEIIRPLGRGGMGRVFLARDTKLGRLVAVKLIARPSAARFLREAHLTAQLQHENIVVIHDVGTVGDESYLILEYLDGEPFNKLMARGLLSATRAAELMLPVVRALQHAHRVGIIHRDLKPSNVFVTQEGIVKVLDFGLARWIESPGPPAEIPPNLGEVSDLTPAGALVGSLPYTAPEQWGYGGVDHRVDIWAVGVILYEMVAGERPFTGRRVADYRTLLSPERPSPCVSEICEGLPPEFVALVSRCLSKEKTGRHLNAATLGEALEELVPRHRRLRRRHGECPFLGLAAFRESDGERFYGRDREITALLRHLRREPLTAVLGPSGVGKSSLVLAGAIPTLKESGEPWQVLTLRPGRRPLMALAATLAAVDPSADQEELEELEEELRQEPGALGRRLRAWAKTQETTVLLYVDQLEELYTLTGDRAEQQAFAACLSGAIDSYAPVRLVVSLRSDFLDRVAIENPLAAMITKALFLLQPLGRDNLLEALVQPLRAAGYGFEPAELAEELVDSLEQTSSPLPILQFAALRLWEARDATRQLITRDSYAAAGGIAGTLARHADEVVQALPASARRVARSVFLRLVTSERTRAVVDLDELAELGPTRPATLALIEQLVSARLLVSNPNPVAQSPTIELIHESLIAGWPTLGRWLDTSHQDGLIRAQLHAIARQWLDRGRPDGLLWRDETAEEARGWRARYHESLTEPEEEYLAAVSIHAARAGRLRRWLRVAALAVAATIVVGSMVAIMAIRRAERAATGQAEVAESEAARARAAEEAARQREREARTAKEQAESAKREVKTALGHTEVQRQIAEQEAANARHAFEQARAAELAERQTRQRLEQALARERALLANERERVRLLEHERERLTTELR